ncbi:uncharacterized protein BO88DRAFT_407776 [Aspergillus vadensis CBS 113365]|uniref:Uncharacterized protein n=1 Tax=Aspergillus vadensis (strain CBS 113365 / IMI 142717 / IBT 24658) TaxID=1448311 RepID=A0A319AZA7_ASPVC|nr:hypothetical protein BO88DRAFT_407776 [Aspergillus vadensis CBS 113365]PYH65155.1 hypothetical protein BO88DRAFT_407776 [Aspergillus vadensis CBS 113365]
MMYYDVYDVEPHDFCPRKPNVHDATRKEAGTDASVTFFLASRHQRLAVSTPLCIPDVEFLNPD